MTKLIPGTPAPDFELPTDSGAPFKLSDHKGKSVLLYFYPQADTPACTNQNLDFTRLAEDFERANTILVGISPDSVEKLAKFRAKYDLSPILIAIRIALQSKPMALGARKRTTEKHIPALSGRPFLSMPKAILRRFGPTSAPKATQTVSLPPLARHPLGLY